MKDVSNWAKFVLILTLAFLSVPAARAATADDFWNKAGLSDFKDDLAVFGARLDKVEAGDKIWSADGGLFGLPSVKFFVYWVSASPVPLPVVAIPLPVDLTVSTLTNYLFDGDGYLNLGLNHPVVFWSPKGDVQLRNAEMPPLVREQAKSAGLPEAMRLAKVAWSSPGFASMALSAAYWTGVRSKPFLAVSSMKTETEAWFSRRTRWPGIS